VTTKKPPKIPGGYILLSRQIIDSVIFYSKPDKWLKIWLYILSKVNFDTDSDYERGSGFVEYKKIVYFTGATRDQIKHCIEYLKTRHMIATQKATRGMHLTVNNYNFYQNPSNYESHTETQNKATQKPHYRKEGEKFKKSLLLG